MDVSSQLYSKKIYNLYSEGTSEFSLSPNVHKYICIYYI